MQSGTSCLVWLVLARVCQQKHVCMVCLLMHGSQLCVMCSGTSDKGHNRIPLHSKDTVRGPKCLFCIPTIHYFVTSKKWTA